MFRILSVFFVIATSTVFSGGAAAGATVEPAEESGQSRAPTVSFLDDRSLSVKAERLTDKGHLEVSVHNDLPKPQKVTLQVVGPEESEDKAVRAFFAEPKTDQTAPPGGTARLKLSVTETLPKTEEASFDAVLVASGESGGLARRELTVSLEKGEQPTVTGDVDPDEDSVANVLRPKQAVEVTLTAINFLPSPLANATSFGFFLIVLLGFMILALHRQLRRADKNLPLLLGALVVLIGIVSTIVLVSQGDWDQPSVHAISSRPIPVESELSGVGVGAAASESGKVAQIEVAGGEMRPQGLEGAGSFKGTYDLTSDAEGGNAAANIKVRDFWLYAVLAIMAGLAIAYSLQRWYDQTRPGWKVRLRFQRMRNQYRGKNQELRKEVEDAPFKDLSLEDRFERLWTEVREKLDEPDRAGATKLLDEMTGYLNKYYLLWRALGSLDKSSAVLKKWWEDHPLDLDLADLESYRDSQKLLRSAPEATSPERDAEVLSTKLKEVEDQDALMREAALVLESVLRHLNGTRSLLGNAGDHEKAVKELEGELEELGRKVLKVKDAEALGEIEEEDDKAGSKLLQLVRQINDAKDQPVELTVGDPRLFRAVWSGEIRPADVGFLEQLADAPDLSSMPDAQAAAAGEGEGPESVEEEERSLADYDRMVAATAFALAVASGMTVLYLNDPAWGEPVDYLSALVWGGISGAGVKLAAGVANRVLPQ